MRNMKIAIISASIAVLLLIALPVQSSRLIGGDFEIYADNFSFSSTASSSGGSYVLYDSGGELTATSTSGGDYALRGGFQAAEKGVLSFTASESSLDLGTLSTGSVAAAVVTITISTDSETGFVLSVTEDGELRSGANDIDDITDGSVIAGTEEYGIQFTAMSGGILQFGDTRSISATPRNIMIGTGETTGAYVDLLFNASIDDDTVAGTYSHTVYFTATINP